MIYQNDFHFVQMIFCNSLYTLYARALAFFFFFYLILLRCGVHTYIYSRNSTGIHAFLRDRSATLAGRHHHHGTGSDEDYALQQGFRPTILLQDVFTTFGTRGGTRFQETLFNVKFSRAFLLTTYTYYTCLAKNIGTL